MIRLMIGRSLNTLYTPPARAPLAPVLELDAFATPAYPAQPVTLALRTLPRDPRRWLLTVLHSRVAKVLTFPPLTLALYVVSPWALYFSSWYDATLSHVWLHELMHLHLVVVGSLFFWPIVGVDPVPGRVPYPFRMLMVVLTRSLSIG